MEGIFMTIYDYVNRKVPAYYKTMYMDGYTPQEILYAKRQTMLLQKPKLTQQEEKQLTAVIETAIDDILKNLL